jgi:hypothetical protein
MQPTVEMGTLDLLHVEGGGSGVTCSRITSWQTSTSHEAQDGGILLAAAPQFGPTCNRCNLLGGERTSAQVIPMQPISLPS